MAKETKGPKSGGKNRFGPGLLIYAWILMILGGAALFILQGFLKNYEASRPKYYVDSYTQLLREEVPSAAVLALDGLDPQILSPAEKEAWLRELLQDAVLEKDAALSREERQVYAVKAADGQLLGRAVFAPADRAEYGLPVWGTAEESFDFSAYYKITEITVPSDYSVCLGGKLLDKDCIVESGIPYALLEECYLHYENLPTMVRYRTPPFVGEPLLQVLDQTGQAVPEERLTEDAFLDRCPAEIREKAEAFVPRFVELYMLFSADIQDASHLYYDQLKRMVRQDSQLHNQLRLAFEGLGYASPRSVRLLSVDINRITDLGEGRYLADLSYCTEITGSNGPVEIQDRVLLVLIDSGGTLLADARYFLA